MIDPAEIDMKKNFDVAHLFQKVSSLT